MLGTIELNEKEYLGDMTDEVCFLEECLSELTNIFSDYTEKSLETLFPTPKGKTKKNVKTGHQYIMDVAKEIRRLQAENLYLRTTLDGIYTNVINGDETKLKELKIPKSMMGDQLLLEVEANIKEVTEKFQEIKT
ncbi:hypothetical protein CHS0354_009725 [Potamilus streckersoni]|uniref:Uncharacterized protein n=1 Tax=Potamilus streckersoni TaxID=2493646 RepID=A0AAE0S0E4_9BIVA|nr:hypothetical protein CHS0354_009725 [Potamilus streckersoni]